jgi:serine/threonine-protein kinase
MAPERVVNPDGVDHRSDIYALGCVAYWLITGGHVFETHSSAAQLVEHVKTTPTPPSQRTELPIPPGLDAIVMKSLEKNPADRFQIAEDMAAALHDVPLSEPWDTRRADGWWDLHMRTAS